MAVVFFTELIYVFLGTRFSARRYYPTSVFQTEMSKMENSETDYEITETQEYKKIKQYAFSDATGGSGNKGCFFGWHGTYSFLLQSLGLSKRFWEVYTQINVFHSVLMSKDYNKQLELNL